MRAPKLAESRIMHAGPARIAWLIPATSSPLRPKGYMERDRRARLHTPAERDADLVLH